ncbi:hypothetical protein [Nocardiopsis valliformis]|uniref:hypothetical protein n=1 Tax=Nocardiopsis valliformis TaxID=239974 RepID=UPI00034AA6FF|nr:hypothetical protein [Nocardiopsis valliformis]
MAAFETVWRSIEAHAGQVFHTKRGIPFSYAVRYGQVHLDNTNRILPRTDFVKAHGLMPLSGPGELPGLQGPSYIFGILTDRRIGGPDPAPVNDHVPPRVGSGRRYRGMSRDDSDEAYVIGLCDEVLGETGLPQHRFDWLLGDPGANGKRAKLPVDAYWPGHELVVEYRELQHDQPMPHFDKPDKLTVSGVHRGEQRARYDRRRETEIPPRGLRLVVIRPADLDADSRGRLRRTRTSDLEVVRGLLARSSDEDRVLDAFRRWLTTEGWTPATPTEPWTGIEAERGGERLIIEAKGRTEEQGTGADVAYGRLLRRMTDQSPATRYALVLPTASVRHAARVPAHVRCLLRVDLYEVTDDNRVLLRPAAPG